jgi:shikimate kinase
LYFCNFGLTENAVVIKTLGKNTFSIYITMKKNNYMLKLAHENYVLRIKCNDLQKELLEIKEKQEELYRNHANTVLVLQSNYIKKNRSSSF